MLLYGDPSICTNLEESIDSFESIMKHISLHGINGMTIDSEVAQTCAVTIRDIHNRIHLIFGDEFGEYGHLIAENINTAVSTLIKHGFTKIASRNRIFNRIGRAPLGSTAIIFESLPKALIFRHVNGGWIFESDRQIIWFDCSFTPTTIILHSLTKGENGRLI